MLADNHIKRAVYAAIGSQTDLNVATVGITTHDGIVTLTGYVDTPHEKDEILAVISRVTGVVAVVVDLDIGDGLAERSDDQRIAAMVVRQLALLNTHGNTPVKIQVCQRYVTLVGTLESDEARIEAERCVADVPGVIGVSNHIELDPAAVVRDVCRRIKQAQVQNGETALSDRIDVSMQNGVVTLQGCVASSRIHGIIRRAALTAPGVIDVVDNIEVPSKNAR